MIDGTALPPAGQAVGGMGWQCCGRLGKRANCQSLVSLTPAAGEVPVPLRLFLPDEWVADPARSARRAGGRRAVRLADAGYGISAAFRHALDERVPLWAELPKVPAG